MGTLPLSIAYLRFRIRDVNLILHQAVFFSGDVHHVKKEVDAEGKRTGSGLS